MHEDAGKAVLIDLPGLRQRFDDDEELLGEIFEVFIAETPTRRADIEAALASADYGRITELAHSLKGVAGTMFAMPLRQAAYDLEMAARQADTASVAALARVVLLRLEDTCRHVDGLVSDRS